MLTPATSDGYYAEIEASTATLAGLLETRGATLPVRACPGWTLGDLVSHAEASVTIRAGHAKADVAIAGPASRLVLVLVGRLPPDDPAITVHGERALLDRWLARTPF